MSISGCKRGNEQLNLLIRADFWYKVSRSERVSYNGITPASQADNEGSIPFTRSTSSLRCQPSESDMSSQHSSRPTTFLHAVHHRIGMVQQLLRDLSVIRVDRHPNAGQHMQGMALDK